MIKNLYLLCFVFLFSCSNQTASSQKENKETFEKASSVNKSQIAGGLFKTGVYHAYQLSGAGYGFQYKFELLDNGEYKMFNKTGSFSYEPATNVIRFTSGGLKDYTGIFTRVDHVNNTRKLMIVLDFHGDGVVPDTLALGKKPGGYYQYAYYQGEK